VCGLGCSRIKMCVNSLSSASSIASVTDGPWGGGQGASGAKKGQRFSI